MSEETRPADDAAVTKPDEETIDKPVMDGADEVLDGDEDPRKGQSDPALIRHPEKDDKTIAPYNT